MEAPLGCEGGILQGAQSWFPVDPSRLLLVLYIGVGIGVLRLAGSVGPIDPLTTADLRHQIRLDSLMTGGLRPIDPHRKGVAMPLIRLDSLAARGSIRTDPHAGGSLGPLIRLHSRARVAPIWTDLLLLPSRKLYFFVLRATGVCVPLQREFCVLRCNVMWRVA